MTENVISFQNLSHENLPSSRWVDARLPAVNLHSFSFFSAREVVANVGADEHCAPGRWFHGDGVGCCEKIVAKHICWLLKERTKRRRWRSKAVAEGSCLETYPKVLATRDIVEMRFNCDFSWMFWNFNFNFSLVWIFANSEVTILPKFKNLTKVNDFLRCFYMHYED